MEIQGCKEHVLSCTSLKSSRASDMHQEMLKKRLLYLKVQDLLYAHTDEGEEKEEEKKPLHFLLKTFMKPLQIMTMQKTSRIPTSLTHF